MSNQVTVAQVKQYSSNVFHLVQQKGSRFMPLVRRESISSEESFYDRIGAVDAVEKTGRHADIIYSETPHSRRRVVSKDYYYADLVDKEDKLRIIHEPGSEYAIAARDALSRKIDDIVITAALGNAYSGKEGATAVALGNSQKLVATDESSATGSRFNVGTLRKVKKKFNANEAGDGELYFAFSSEQADDLLGETEVTSSDYNSVKALVQGDVDTFMGFMFIRTERLPVTAAATTFTVATGAVGAGSGTLAAGARRCFAWQRQGLLLASAREVFTRMDEIPQKHYATQVYAAMSMGATRMEEERVVEVMVKES